MRWSYSQLRPVKNGGHAQKLPRMQVPPFLQQLRLCSAPMWKNKKTCWETATNISLLIQSFPLTQLQSPCVWVCMPAKLVITGSAVVFIYWSQVPVRKYEGPSRVLSFCLPVSVSVRYKPESPSGSTFLSTSASHQHTNTESQNKHLKITEKH